MQNLFSADSHTSIYPLLELSVRARSRTQVVKTLSCKVSKFHSLTSNFLKFEVSEWYLEITNLSATVHNKLQESTQYCTILDRKHMDEHGHDVIRM